jgi:hypothetical protein
MHQDKMKNERIMKSLSAQILSYVAGKDLVVPSTNIGQKSHVWEDNKI